MQNTDYDDNRRSKLPLKDSLRAAENLGGGMNDTSLAPQVDALDKRVNLKKFFNDISINEEG
jgi:hypothetical protein